MCYCFQVQEGISGREDEDLAIEVYLVPTLSRWGEEGEGHGKNLVTVLGLSCWGEVVVYMHQSICGTQSPICWKEGLIIFNQVFMGKEFIVVSDGDRLHQLDCYRPPYVIFIFLLLRVIKTGVDRNHNSSQ